jgi:hypothetical protein
LLEPAVGGNQTLAERGEPGAPAPGTADAHGGRRLSEGVIEVIEQQPGAAIAHAELAGGLREGTGPIDLLQEADLAGSDGTGRTQIDA